jgi:hypothetical protein
MRFLGLVLFFATSAAADSPVTPKSALQVQNARPKGSLHKLSKSSKTADGSHKSEPVAKDESVDMQDPVARALMAASTVYVNADIDKKRRIASQQRDKAQQDSEAAREKAEQVHAEVVAQQGQASKEMAQAMKHEAVVAAGQGVSVDHETMAAATDTLVKDQLKKDQEKEKVASKEQKPVESAAMAALDKQLVGFQEELVGKEKDLKVQTELEAEKETVAQASKLQMEKLKKQTDEYQREADVARQIAEEKAEMAKKVMKQEDSAAKKYKDNDDEEKEAAKFLKQTKAEVEVLQNKAKATRAKKIALQKEEAAARKKKAEDMKAHAIEEAEKAQKEVDKAAKDEKEAAAEATDHKVDKSVKDEKEAAAEPTDHKVEATEQSVSKPETAKKGTDTKPPVTHEKDVPMSEEAVRKLMEENEHLKKEKEELESQLARRKVQQEKDKLKQKLKNKLAVVDRHSKVVKAKKH